MHRLLIFILSLFLSQGLLAQELNCNVTIDATQVADIQPAIIEDVRLTIQNFLNQRYWTSDTYKPEERIRCNLAITITDVPQIGFYEATAQIQFSRPVFGTSYETVMFNYLDKSFNFELNQGQPIDFNEQVFSSAISSLLSFYAYIILSIDYDSFGELSGQPHLEKAFNIANVALSNAEGWTVGNDPNSKGALIEALYNQQLLPLREAYYTYHRLILDTYLDKPAAVAPACLEVLKKLKTVMAVRPYTVPMRNFFIVKSDELMNIFKESTSLEVKNEAVALLRQLDPTNAQKWDSILRN